MKEASTQSMRELAGKTFVGQQTTQGVERHEWSTLRILQRLEHER